MAHHKSAIKRIRISHRAYLRNRHYRSMMRTAIRQVQEAENSDIRREHLRLACATLDRLVSKGIIHRNTAARRKSSLHRYVSRTEVQPEVEVGSSL